MVCLVHDRRYLSQFHATVNKLRGTKQFSAATLRVLPRKCCSCAGRYKNSALSKSEPLIESIDFDVLQMICFKLDFERCLQYKIKSSTSQFQNYAILSFTNVPKKINSISLAMEFITQRTDQVSLEFITSGSSIEFLHTAIKYQYDLVKQCSNYTEIEQNLNGLWVIINGNGEKEVNAMKKSIENDWKQFLECVITRTRYTMYRAPKTCFPLLKISQCLCVHQSKIIQDKRLQKKTARAAYREQQKKHVEYSKYMVQTIDERYLQEDFIDGGNVFTTLDPCLYYPLGKYESSNKIKRSRIHRRQHTLALALFV